MSLDFLKIPQRYQPGMCSLEALAVIIFSWSLMEKLGHFSARMMVAVGENCWVFCYQVVFVGAQLHPFPQKYSPRFFFYLSMISLIRIQLLNYLSCKTGRFLLETVECCSRLLQFMNKTESVSSFLRIIQSGLAHLSDIKGCFHSHIFYFLLFFIVLQVIINFNNKLIINRQSRWHWGLRE